MEKKNIEPATSVPMEKKDTKLTTSVPMEKDTVPATEVPMEKLDTMPATSVSMEKEWLKPCSSCLQLPGTKIDFSHWFSEMAKFECSACGEMRALYSPPSDESPTNSYYVASDVEEDQGSDWERY